MKKGCSYRRGQDLPKRPKVAWGASQEQQQQQWYTWCGHKSRVNEFETWLLSHLAQNWELGWEGAPGIPWPGTRVQRPQVQNGGCGTVNLISPIESSSSSSSSSLYLSPNLWSTSNFAHHLHHLHHLLFSCFSHDRKEARLTTSPFACLLARPVELICCCLPVRESNRSAISFSPLFFHLLEKKRK